MAFQLGPVQIDTVNDGVINFGNAKIISPSGKTITVAGAGGLNTGAFINTNTLLSVTVAKLPKKKKKPLNKTD
ncbi:spore germination protein [Pontibacillus salicampi]|uniref:Spore germination protein n=1 Tax=Pontibacillus salicampi TaxID=1449801 RepID=A0ABV6LQ18_9BACI